MFLFKRYLFVLLFIGANRLLGQVSVKDSVVFAPLLRVSYSFQMPERDLKERFGNNSNVGLDLVVKTKKNWLIGLDGTYLFGTKLKEDSILKNIATADGDVLTANGQLAEVRLFERGYTAQVKFGKLFPIVGPNKNSGFFILTGVGFLQHKIRIDNIGNTAPQLNKEYKKGYDRLSNGFAVSEFIGYSFLSNNRRINFFLGVEFYQAWTKNRRTYNYDLMKRDNASRTDFLNGFRFGWIIPLYKKMPNEFYYH